MTLHNGSIVSGQGSNSVHVRQGNERVILGLLRRLGTAAKADLARHANLTANTIGQIVQDLETAGLVRSDGKRQGERGQPATLLRLDPQGACSIGVKTGRRSLDTILGCQRRRELGASGGVNFPHCKERLAWPRSIRVGGSS